MDLEFPCSTCAEILWEVTIILKGIQVDDRVDSSSIMTQDTSCIKNPSSTLCKLITFSYLASLEYINIEVKLHQAALIQCHKRSYRSYTSAYSSALGEQRASV